jgi:hypothetical protein
MFDFETSVDEVPPVGNWRSFLRQRLVGNLRDIAHIVHSDHEASAIQFGLIKSGNLSVSIKARIAGKNAHFKVFLDGSTAAKAYVRERDLQRHLRGTGLTPDLIAFSDRGRFLISQSVESFDWDTAVTRFDATDVAWEIGSWQALFDHEMPAKPASGNWYGYLARVWPELPLNAVDGARDALSGIPLCGSGIARCDAALHNFLIDGDGVLLGCDFEEAQLRPVGWDYIMTVMALIQRMPDRAGELVDAFSDGFARHHRGALIMDELNRLACVVACASAQIGRVQEMHHDH